MVVTVLKCWKAKGRSLPRPVAPLSSLQFVFRCRGLFFYLGNFETVLADVEVWKTEKCNEGKNYRIVKKCIEIGTPAHAVMERTMFGYFFRILFNVPFDEL